MKNIFYIVLAFVFTTLGCKQSSGKETFVSEKSISANTLNSKKSVVFIAGFDEGKNTYYKNATTYFENKNMKIVDNLFSLEEIISWLNKNNTYESYEQIHIVSHSNAWRGMSLKATKNGERITLETLMIAEIESSIPELQNCITNTATKLIFHSCGLGENQELLKELKKVFTTEQSPVVYASPFFNVFGGKYAGHYLAKPFYGYYPTAESPGIKAISKEFETQYSTENINWYTALKTRQEGAAGEAYSYKFNIPIDWEYTFNNIDDIPKLNNRNEIMDWIIEDEEITTVLFKLGIPIEKYRWRSSIINNKLIIKGKTTVLCVMQPIVNSNDKNEYRLASLNDKELYQVL